MNAPLAFNPADLALAMAPAPVIPSIVANATPGFAAGSFSGSLANDEYHSLNDRISCSGLKALLRSPKHYKAYLDAPDDDGVKPNFGTAAHCIVLEPKAFDDRYSVFDGTRKGPAWNAFSAKHVGKLILNRSEYRRVLGIREAVMTYEDYPLAEALSLGESEKSIFWTDPETGVLCRIRVDSLNPFVAFDLKTIDDARPDSALRQAINMDYDLQAAYYTEGIRAYTGKEVPFIFAYAEDKAPHGVWLHQAGEKMIENGRRKMRRGLEAFRRLQETDNWHGYTGAMSTMEFPAWALRH